MPIQQISPAEAAAQKGAEGVIYQDTTNPGQLYVRGASGSLSVNPLTAGLTSAQVAATQALVSGGGNIAFTTLDGTTGSYNGATLWLAAGATLTVAAGALAVLGAGVTIIVGQSGSATLAFSGGATKENASGTSASSVTLAASGSYALLPSPGGSDKWRLSGGASI